MTSRWSKYFCSHETRTRLMIPTKFVFVLLLTILTSSTFAFNHQVAWSHDALPSSSAWQTAYCNSFITTSNMLLTSSRSMKNSNSLTRCQIFRLRRPLFEVQSMRSSIFRLHMTNSSMTNQSKSNRPFLLKALGLTFVLLSIWWIATSQWATQAMGTKISTASHKLFGLLPAGSCDSKFSNEILRLSTYRNCSFSFPAGFLEAFSLILVRYNVV